MNTQTWQLPKNYVIDPDTGDMTIFNHDGSITVLRKDPATGAYSLEHNGVKVSQDQFNLSMLWALMKETAKAPGMEGPDIQDVIPLVLAAASGDGAKHTFLDDMAKALKAQSEAVLAGVSRQTAHAQFLRDASAVVQKNSAGMAQHLDASARATLNKALAGLAKADALEIRAARSGRAADLIDARYGKIGAVLDVVSLLSALAEGDSNEILKTSLGILAGIVAGSAAAFFGAPMLLGLGIGLLGSWGAGQLYDAFIGPNIGDLGNFWDNLFGALGLGDGVGGDFAAARNLVPRRDPLALDLDGDGIETVGVRAGVLFDHDGDGVRQGTGWIGPDDGLLVLDRNGNGRIDNGTELFGVDTPLPDGSQPRSGFAALSSLDSNGDGIFDARDARFADVRVWRDLNQDGISQATELFTLEGLGIASIGLTPHSVDDQNLGNGNIIDNHGTYVRTDGSSGAIVDMQFAVENFYREFDRGTHPVTLLDAVKALPDLRGSGAVRDLREAASLSPALLQALQAVVPGMSRDALLARIDGIVTLWAASSGMKTGEEIIEGEAGGRTLRYHGVVPQSVQAQGESAVSAWKTAQHATLGPIIALLERFNGSTLVSISGDRVSTGGRGFGGGAMQTEIDVELWPEQIAPLLRAHAALVDSVYGALALGVRLKDVMASFRPVFGSQGLSWDTAGMTAALWAKWQGDTLGALQDVMDIKRYASAQMEMADWPGLSVLTEMVRQTRALAGGDQVLARAGISLVQGSASGGSGQDWLWGGTAADTINGGAGADFLVGGEGDDRLNGNGGDDEIAGGVGNDRLVGGDGSDVLLGEQGDDNLEGEGGNDLLIGGAGNDKLRGGFGNDTYHFDLGWGSDRLYNDDTSRGRTDIIRFGAGILASDIRVSRSYSDLLLTHANGDRITVDMGLYYDALAGTAYRIDEVHFDDGTIWTMEQIKQMLLQPTSGADSITGYASDDTLRGGEGNDKIFGEGGNDTLYGDAGNDDLDGGAGNDVLIGGSGNDTLRGGNGSDTYRFDLGWGSDKIVANDTGTGRVETIQFGEGILASDIRLSRTTYDLVLTHSNGDRITVDMGLYNDALAGSYYRIDQVSFADGTLWSMDQIKQMLLQPTSGADSITGYASDDTLRGGEGNDKILGEGGNDTLYGDAGNDDLDGGAGNDVLIGGGGNDTLRGGAGSDTYHFDLGWGSDKIVANDTGTGRVEAIRFGEGILASDIRLSRTTNDLVLTHSNGDRITVDMGMYYDAVAGSYYRIDQVSFADGTLWSMDQIKQMLLQPTSGADSITGYASDDTLRGGEGNDKILGEGGNDTLYGDAGNDDLDGGAGNDVLIGGSGNDTLRGGNGSDTYRFELGWGSDKIVANDTGTGRVETIQFGEGILASDIRLSRTTNDLVLTHSNGDRITVDMGMYYDAVAGSYYRIDQVSFADGTLWTMDQIKLMLLQPTPGADRQLGYASNDILDGGEGNDELDGAGGNDVLIGGGGNDILRGGAGSDTYHFDLGWGSDRIIVSDTGVGRVETVRFGAGI
ncbi:TPA: calcium-binding protein, partial [Stenotrophomonas maltophilia]